jgi:hypothetical protein
MGNQERHARDDLVAGDGANVDLSPQDPGHAGADMTRTFTRNIIPMIRKADLQKKTPSSREASPSLHNHDQVQRRQIADQIGRQLRGMYDGLLNQPVPDRFLDLVRELENGDKAGTA